MHKRARTRIFPLHLSPIDEFFRADDRPEYPMAFTSHLTFSGEIDRTAFLAAADVALKRHPLLQALTKAGKGGRLCWVAANDVRPRIQWGRFGDPFTFEDTEQIDLTREVGLRLWVFTSNDRSEILLQFHHACCDGTGAYRFIGDLLAEYGLRTAFENPPVIESCDVRLLKDRRRKMTNEVRHSSRFAMIQQALLYGLSTFVRKIAPLSSLQSDGTGNVEETIDSRRTHEYPGIVTCVFDRSQYTSLRAAASAEGAMFNDLLLTEMFVTIRDWNRRCGNRRRQWLRIMMPVDLRGKDEITMPAANMTGYSFITRSSKDCDDTNKLLQSIRDETLRIKRDKIGHRFMNAVTLGLLVPGFIKFLLGRKRCLATVVLSNVGDPSRRFLSRFPRKQGKVRCGNVRLESISGVPPLRPLSRATVSIVTYGREFAINVRCDPQTMSLEDANEFIDLYVSRLQRHLPNANTSESESESDNIRKSPHAAQEILPTSRT